MYNAEGEYGKYAKQAAFVKEGKDEPFVKESDDELLPRMVTGLGTAISPLPQGQLAVYIVQDDDEPLSTKGLRAAYAVQGKNKPLTTIGDWAMTFDDPEGAKAPTVKLIAPIAILHHCNEAP
jgi:hypothetical protein